MKLLAAFPIIAVAAAASHHSHLRLEERNTDKNPFPSFGSLSERSDKMDPDLQQVVDLVQNTIWYEELQLAASAASSRSTTSCESPFANWEQEKIEEMGVEVYQWLAEKGVFMMPFIFKDLFDRNDHGEYFGVDGGETDELIARHESASAFWESVDTSGTLDTHNIKLLGAHGTILQDPLALGTLLLLFGVHPLHIPYWVSTIQNYIEDNVPGRYNNPLFTANGLAIPSLDFFEVELIPSAIILGDGIIEFCRDVGLGRDGPDFIHAHEYGHHLQIDIDASDDDEHLPVPEQTRRTDLMADALGGYFLAHGDGGSLPEAHIQELHETAFVAGDCQTTNDSHHGTPLQRECAAMWGASQAVADSASGDIMHPSDFRSTFDNVLDDIIAVDQSVCQTLASRV